MHPSGPGLHELPDTIGAMGKAELAAWLSGRGRPAAGPSTKPDMIKMTTGMCRVGDTLLVRAGSVPDIEAERGRNDHACWAQRRGSGWQSGTTSEVMSGQPSLMTEMVTAHFQDMGADTTRNREGGRTRFVSGAKWRWSKPPAEKKGAKPGYTAGGRVPVMVYEYWCVVGKSYAGKFESDLDKRTARAEAGHDGRPVYTKLLCLGHTGPGPEVLAILECSCLLPEGACNGYAQAGKLGKVASDYRHCRDHGRCLHCRAALEVQVIARSCDSSSHSCTSATRHEPPEL